MSSTLQGLLLGGVLTLVLNLGVVCLLRRTDRPDNHPSQLLNVVSEEED